MHIAESVAKEKGVLSKKCIINGWWRRFLARQGDLSLRRGDSMAHVRMNAINEETMGQYFALLKEVLVSQLIQNEYIMLMKVECH